MLDMVNQQRHAVGAGPLTLDVQCNEAAHVQASDQATHLFMGHVGSDGSTVGDRLTRTGFKWDGVAENAAEGYNTVEEVMAGWVQSSGHYANIVNAKYTRFGYSQQKGSDGNFYWTQVFAHPQTGYTPQNAEAPGTNAPTIQPKVAAIPSQAPAEVISEATPKPSTTSQPTTGAPASKPVTISEAQATTTKTPEVKQVNQQVTISEAQATTARTPEVTQVKQQPIGIVQNIFNIVQQMLVKFDNLPADIQAIVGDNNQYSMKVMAYLKDKVPVATNVATYNNGHPGTSDKFDNLTYSFYTQ